jgi:hypothetical protein
MGLFYSLSFMQISKKSLDKFKQIFEKRFDEKLSDEDVFRKASYLLGVIRAVYGDISSQNFDNRKDEQSSYDSNEKAEGRFNNN